MKLGTAERPVWVAIVGSGPSGFYAAEVLLKRPHTRVDMFDRLPTPYGLVRGGVAPDHQKMKSVTKAYAKVADSPAFRFFGNVMLGRDVQTDELRERYDQLVLAVGNESDRHLGIPGEELEGSHSATRFVGWYNGHPDHQDDPFDLRHERIAVIGLGNVAMDVTRILAQDPAVLAGTDIAQHALEVLQQSRVKEIWLIGRRGPAQAAFSLAEIKELGEVKGADLVVNPDELVLDEVSNAELSNATAKKNVDYLIAHSKLPLGNHPRKVRLRFCLSPVEVLGENGHVCALKLERNRLVPDGKGSTKAVGTGLYEVLPVSMVFRSVGYRGVPIAGVPFDEVKGHISNAGGRLLDASGSVIPREYVVGWAKRGPQGLIGTNRGDSAATVAAMLDDLAADGSAPARKLDSIEALLRERKVKWVTFDDWKALDRWELERGAAAHKLREKVTRIAEMIERVPDHIAG